jgi:hypothetical protein
MPAENGNGNNVPLYRIQVVGRDIPAINYWHRSGSTKIGFAGTSLLPQGKGEGMSPARGKHSSMPSLRVLFPRTVSVSNI